VRFGPALVFTLALAWPPSEGWLAHLGREPAREDLRVVADGRALEADLYRPATPRGAMLLVHGLSRAGRRHPELARLARLLAREGTLVLVPHFPGLAAYRLDGSEVAEIRTALRYLAATSEAVSIVGLSFGAGPALLAAADFPRLRVVGSFGGYADLRNVIAFVTTGVHTLDGRRYVRRQEEYNRWKLLALLAGFVETSRDRAGLERIAGQKLANPSAPTSALERDLGREGLAVMAVVLNRREDLVPRLLGALPARARVALDRLSPLPVMPRLRGQLLIAHGVDDDSIPFTESLRLAQAVPGRARVAIFRTFRHIGPVPMWRSLWDRVGDGWKLLGLADDLLAR
jgi:hypothetical protein